MSETWGPRAHPEKCDEHFEAKPGMTGYPVGWPKDRPRKSIEESLGTMFGILMLALILGGAVLWWVR